MALSDRMKATMEPVSVPASPGASPCEKSSFFRTLALALPWLLVTVLCVTNLMTLSSPGFHLEGRHKLSAVLEAVMGLVPEQPLNIDAPRTGLRTALAIHSASIIQEVVPVRQKALEATVELLQREAQDMKVLKREADSRYISLQSEQMRLAKLNADLNNERKALRAVSFVRAKAVRSAAARLTTRLAVRAGETIAELPVRAAPYIGTVALVVSTSIDIQADCELTRTLNALVLEHGEPAVDTGAVCQYVSRIPTAPQVWGQVESRASAMMQPLYRALENRSKTKVLGPARKP